jgi:transposase
MKTRGLSLTMSGDSVCAVARRHDLLPQQLFGWRRQLRVSEAERAGAVGPQFVPAVVDGVSSRNPQPRVSRCKADADAGTIEIDGVPIRIGLGADADAKTLMVVPRALKDGV